MRTGAPARRGPHVLLAAALAALVAAIYLPTLGHDYVWDDVQYIASNDVVGRGLTAAGLRWALTTFHGANWHPLTWLSHMLDAAVFGPGPAGPHLVNVLLHAANTLAVFGLFRLLTGALWRSLLVAAVFAAHPLHVESVAWAAERKDVLSALFGLLSLLAWRRYARRPGPARFGAVLLLFAAGLMSKPMVVTLPFVMALLDVWPLGRWRAAGWPRVALEKAPLLILSAGASALTWAAQTREGSLMPLPLPGRAANALESWVRYAALTAWPADLAVIYPHPLRTGPVWHWAGAALLLAGASALAIAGARRRPWAAVGWLWFGGMLVPVIGFVQVGSQAMADRYMYLPLLGLSVLLAWGLGEAARRLPRLRAGISVAAACLVLVFSAAAAVQVRFWRDAGLLFGHAVEVTAGNAEAHDHLGEYHEARGDAGRALEHFRAAVLLRPGDPTALNNLGVLLARRGDRAEAESLFRAAIRADPSSGLAHANLARQLARRGLAAEALAHFREAVRLAPRDAEANLELARLLLEAGRDAEAAAPLERAVALYRERLERNPRDADAHLNLGALLAWQRRPAEAAAHFAEAARLEPGWADARANLGAALEQLGRRREAAEQYREAARLKPRSAEPPRTEQPERPTRP